MRRNGGNGAQVSLDAELAPHGRAFQALAALQLLIAADALLYYWLSDVPHGQDDGRNVAIATALTAVAAFTLVVVPRAALWALNSSFAATSVLLAIFASTVTSGQGQIETALALIMLAVLIGYVLPDRAIALQLTIMISAYLAALAVNPRLDSPLFALSIISTLLILTVMVARLRASERRYRMLVDNASDVVITTDPDGLITWASPTVTASLGWPAASLVGRRLNDLVHPGDRHALASAPADPEAEVDPPTAESPVVRMKTAASEYRWVSLSTMPLAGTLGRIVGEVTALHLVDDLVSARNSALDASARTHALLDLMHDPYALMEPVRDPDGTVVDFVYTDANESACAAIGEPYGRLIGSRLLDRYPSVARAGLLAHYANVITTGQPLVLDDWEYPDDGATAGSGRFYDVRAVRVGDMLSHTWRDVTQRHRATQDLAASEEQYRLLAENASDVIIRVRDRAIVWVSPSVEDALGWTPEEVTGQGIVPLVHEADVPRFARAEASLGLGQAATFRLRVKASDDRYHWVECHAKPYLGVAGEEDGVTASLHVVDSEVAAEQDLQWRVRHDELTGVLNRREALERMGALHAHPQRHPGPNAAVLFCDVDSFKSLNDGYGHAAGDVILGTLAARISERVRDGDLVARIGGDEFLIVIAGIHTLDQAVHVAEGIRRAAAEPIAVDGHSITATVSIGVTLVVSGESPDALIARADRAMYRAKQDGRNRTVQIGASAP